MIVITLSEHEAWLLSRLVNLPLKHSEKLFLTPYNKQNLKYFTKFQPWLISTCTELQIFLAKTWGHLRITFSLSVITITLSELFLQITWRRRAKFRKYFRAWIRGLGTTDLWKKCASKISCYSPFKWFEQVLWGSWFHEKTHTKKSHATVPLKPPHRNLLTFNRLMSFGPNQNPFQFFLLTSTQYNRTSTIVRISLFLKPVLPFHPSFPPSHISANELQSG